MKISFEISFIILNNYNTVRNQNRNKFVSRKTVIDELKERINKTKDSIATAQKDKRIERAKESLKRKEKALEEVKEIDDWHKFHDSVVNGEYAIGNSKKTLKEMGVTE